MHVLVTGATGFVGFHTVMALLNAGHTVRLAVRSEAKMRKLYAPHGVDITDFVIADITDEAAIDKALTGVDGVVHTAAMVSVDPSMAEVMYETNVLGTRLVIGGAVEKQLQSIVYISSLSTLFDTSQYTIDERSPLAVPQNAYAKAKVDSEAYVRELIAQGAEIAVPIPAVILGPDDPALSEGNQGLSLFVKHCVLCTSSGQQIIDVRELANINVKLLEQKLSGLFVVGGHYLPWRELADKLDIALGQPVRRITVPAQVLRLAGSLTDFLRRFIRIDFPLSLESVTYVTQWVYADDQKVRHALNITYRPIEETLADTVNWLAAEKHVAARWASRIKR